VFILYWYRWQIIYPLIALEFQSVDMANAGLLAKRKKNNRYIFNCFDGIMVKMSLKIPKGGNQNP
jgi:hypothetical protein